MKKIFAFVLAVCMLLTLAACDPGSETETRYVMATQIYEMPDNGIYRETVFHYSGDGKIESMVTTENGEEVGRVEYVMNEDGMVWKQISTEDGVASTTEYAYTLDDAGNIIGIQPKSCLQYSDLSVLQAAAPYVRDKSFILVHGEEQDTWKWVFENGTCRVISPTLVWRE